MKGGYSWDPQLTLTLTLTFTDPNLKVVRKPCAVESPRGLRVQDFGVLGLRIEG